MKAILWFWKNGIKTRKSTLEEKMRLSLLIFSKPKVKLFGRQRKLKSMVSKLFNLNRRRNNFMNKKSLDPAGHLTLAVSNLEKSEIFYKSLFGKLKFKQIRDGERSVAWATREGF